MHQTYINIVTKNEYYFLELKNDVTSVSLNLKRRGSEKDFPLMLIIYMNIKLRIIAASIYLSRITNQTLKKISL